MSVFMHALAVFTQLSQKAVYIAPNAR